jgi:hypothetical protein
LHKYAFLTVAATSAATLALATAAFAQAEHSHAPAKSAAAKPAAAKTAEPKGDAAMIASATKAAPPAVSKTAKVVAMNDKGEMRTLREGTGNFTCMPDNPATPGPDPMCGDANAMEWAMAWAGKKPPPAGKVGFLYMLEGGTDASNTDPYATKPTAENNWVKTGPHVMVVGDQGILAGYPKDAKPDTSKPYVMWANTPYAHLMIPVK